MASVKDSVYRILNEPKQCSGIEKFFSIFLFVVIVLNVLLVFVVYDESIYTADSLNILYFDTISAMIFMVEYFARLWTADKVYPDKTPLRARLRYTISAMGLVDLLSFLPLVLFALGLIPYGLVSSFRILKVLRLLKISRYMVGWQIIVSVFQKNIREIFAAFAILTLFSLTASALMCQFEQPAQPGVFNNIFTGLYWAMQTVTSTGYGDITPITPGGRAVGFFTMVLSIGIVAVPAGIFSAGFIHEFRDRDNDHDEIDINTFYINGTDNKIIIDEEAIEKHQYVNSVIVESETGEEDSDKHPGVQHKHEHLKVSDEKIHSQHHGQSEYPDYAFCPHCGKPLPRYKEESFTETEV